MRKEMAVIRCRAHPRYRGIRPRPKRDCQSCELILILKHQHQRTANDVLGGLNPYQFLTDIQEACEGLEVVLRAFHSERLSEAEMQERRAWLESGG